MSGGEENLLSQALQHRISLRDRRRLHRSLRSNLPQVEPAIEKNEKEMTAVMLATLGFDKPEIQHAFQLYEESYGSKNYNLDMLTEILIHMQSVPKPKHDLYQTYSAVNFNYSNKNKNVNQSKKRNKSGIYRGDHVRYKGKYRAEVLETMDDQLQIAWPVSKPLHYRAVLWVHVSRVQKEKPMEAKKVKKGLFSGWSKKNKTYVYEQEWTDLIVSASDNSKSGGPVLKELEQSEYQFTAMKTQFTKHDTNNYDVINIYKVRNEQLSQLHAIRKQRILQFSLDNDINKLNERVLWYSTSMKEVILLVNNGFKRKYGKSSYWGHGHLFVSQSSAAYQARNCVTDDDGLQYLMYCSVVCGESCLGQPMMKVPIAKPGKNYTMFETSVEDVKNPSLYVTFQDDQAIPLYVVVVKRNAIAKRYKKQKKRYKRAALLKEMQFQMPEYVDNAAVVDSSGSRKNTFSSFGF